MQSTGCVKETLGPVPRVAAADRSDPLGVGEGIKEHPFLPYIPACSLLATKTQWCSVKTIPMVLDEEATMVGTHLAMLKVQYLLCSINLTTWSPLD